MSLVAAHIAAFLATIKGAQAASPRPDSFAWTRRHGPLPRVETTLTAAFLQTLTSTRKRYYQDLQQTVKRENFQALSTPSVEIQLELVGGDSPDFEFLLDTQ